MKHLFPQALLALIFFFNTTQTRIDERLLSTEELVHLIAESKKEEVDSLTEEDLTEIRSINPTKMWTIVIYVAADNDLHYFAWKNLKQMEQIGSNDLINIIVQMNTPGATTTKRYIVKKNRRILVQDDASPSTKLNSGSAHTLIDCMQWAVTHYPAQHYCLIFWNHGSAAIDPIFNKTFNPCNLFYCDPIDNMLNIDRGISYITLLAQQMAGPNVPLSDKRGICFDDTFKSYINNTDLDFALREIQTKILHNNKLDLVIFDACLMSMIEISSIVRKYAHYMATSQEVVYGTGQNYELLFRPFLTQNLSPANFAKHTVLAYEQTYQKIINDYTFSALDLSKHQLLEENVNLVANLLQEALKHQANYSVSNMLRKCKSTQFCTCFDEPSYIDLGDFYTNLLRHLQHINLYDKNYEIALQTNLSQAINQGLEFIAHLVIENRVGSKLRRAQGVSIYFPEHAIASSYLKSPFALSNNWGNLLSKYIAR
jgi:hypothetical protein